MTETEITTDSRSWLESIDPKIAAAGALIALCLGVWLGFKIAGGSVEELASQPLCADCIQRERERQILDEQ